MGKDRRSDLVHLAVAGDRLLHLKFCEPVEQETLGWAMVHYPGRVDAMAKKEFGSDPRLVTDVPFAIGPLMDTFVSPTMRGGHGASELVSPNRPAAGFGSLGQGTPKLAGR